MKVVNVKALAAAGLAAIAAIGTANAADMSAPPPAYKAPPPPAAYSWTGCYIGGGGGFGWWREDSFVQLSTGQAVTAAVTSGGSGWFGQGQGGCDYQFTTPIFNLPAVIGLFGDYEGGDIDGRTSFPGVVGSQRESGTWSAGGRFGVLITPRILTFFDGGWSQAHFDGVNYNLAIAGGGPTGISLAAQTYNGWFIGSGFEYSFDWLPIHGLFLKTEYRYSQYGGNGVNVPITGAGVLVAPAGITLNSQKSTEMVSTELVWRFNWH